MAGIGPGPEHLVGAFLSEQFDASQTASNLSSTDPSGLVGETQPSEVPFYTYISQAAAARNAAAAAAQSQLDATTATGYQEDALQNAIASNEQVATSLTGLADTMAQQDQVAAIQRFRLDGTAENADFVALAKLDDEAGITLGMLDTNA